MIKLRVDGQVFVVFWFAVNLQSLWEMITDNSAFPQVSD